ncbi:unnamed protein product, partial [Ilex paraguariensis]
RVFKFSNLGVSMMKQMTLDWLEGYVNINDTEKRSDLRTSSSFKSKLPFEATSNVYRSSLASLEGDS